MTTEPRARQPGILRCNTEGRLSRHPWPGKDAFLHELYRLIDCRNVDVISLTATIDMWVDDEGLIVGEPEPNYVASGIMHRLGREGLIFGNVVFSGGPNADGDSQPLDPLVEQAIRDIRGTV